MRPFRFGKADFQNVLAAGFHGRRICEGRSRKGQPFLASVVGHFVATRLCSPYIDHEDDNNDNDGDAAIPGCELDQKFRAVVFLFQLGLGCDQRGKGCVALAFIKTDAFVQLGNSLVRFRQRLRNRRPVGCQLGVGIGNSKATVLVRVISVPRENEEDASRFENLVSKIVAATNWQNSIRASDLMANDRRQIEIERNLRKLDYQYVRKRQSKSEARRHAGMRHKFFLKKEELAQAVAACDLDPSVVREGKEQLFEERHYGQIFPNADPYYYLPRYWLVFDVSRKARGFPSRAYAKWLVAHFLWQRILKLLTTRQLKRVFAENDFPSLLTVCNAAFKGAIAFYYTRRGTGETAIDVSSFFKRRGLHWDFERFWKRSDGRYRAIFRRAFDRFETELHKAAVAE